MRKNKMLKVINMLNAEESGDFSKDPPLAFPGMVLKMIIGFENGWTSWKSQSAFEFCEELRCSLTIFPSVSVVRKTLFLRSNDRDCHVHPIRTA